MTEELNRSRTGHISAIARLENSVKEILSKNAATVNLIKVTKIVYTLEKYREQQEKIAAINTDILTAL